MAPPLNPNAAFFDIDAVKGTALIRPNGVDDWDNIQTVMNNAAIAGNPGAVVTFASGTFYLSYQVECVDPSFKMRGTDGKTCIVCGTLTSRILPLDDTDRRIGYSPNGWPSLFLFHETAGGGTPVDLDIEGITFKGHVVKGYDGFEFGCTHPNMGLYSFLSIRASELSLGVMDESRVMNTDGTTATPLLNQNLGTRISVSSLADGAGVEFENGVDYTFDRVAGTVTRLTAGIIGSGAQVFVTYNKLDEAVTASLYKLRVSKCQFLSSNLARDGFEHMSEDRAINIEGAVGVRVRSSQSGVFVTGVYTELGGIFATLKFDLDFFTPFQPLNGVSVTEDCEFENNHNSIVWRGIDGIPANPSTHVYPAGSLRRSVSIVRRNKFKKTGWGSCSFPTMFTFGNGGGNDYIIEDNEAETVMAFWGDRDVHSADFSTAFQRLPGAGDTTFQGAPQSVIVRNNKIRDWRTSPDEFGGSFKPAIGVHDGFNDAQGGEPTLRYVISGNTVERTDPSGSRAAVNVRFKQGVVVEGNIFKTVGEGEGTEAVVLDDDKGSCFGNDFSGWRKQATRSDVKTGPNATDSSLQLEENDLVENQGASTDRTGGTLSTLVTSTPSD